MDTSKLPCYDWSRGNGFCKYAEACRYSHAGPKGSSANKTTLATTVKRAKKNKVKFTSLAVSSSETKRAKGTSNEGNRSWEDESNDSDHLYELVRGVPSVIESNDKSIKSRFIPKRPLIGQIFPETDEK